MQGTMYAELVRSQERKRRKRQVPRRLIGGRPDEGAASAQHSCQEPNKSKKTKTETHVELSGRNGSAGVRDDRQLQEQQHGELAGVPDGLDGAVEDTPELSPVLTVMHALSGTASVRDDGEELAEKVVAELTDGPDDSEALPFGGRVVAFLDLAVPVVGFDCRSFGSFFSFLFFFFFVHAHAKEKKRGAKDTGVERSLTLSIRAGPAMRAQRAHVPPPCQHPARTAHCPHGHASCCFVPG